MNPLWIAVATIIAGIVIAIVGVVLTTRVSNRAANGIDAGTRSDLAVAVSVVGVVAAMFGGAFLAYLLLF